MAVVKAETVSADLRFIAVQQEDGNFVVYARASMTPVWNAWTDGANVPAGPPLPPVRAVVDLDRARKLLTELMLRCSTKYGTTPNFNKIEEDAPLLLAHAEGYAVYAEQADPLLSAFLYAGWQEKYDREFKD